MKRKDFLQKISTMTVKEIVAYRSVLRKEFFHHSMKNVVSSDSKKDTSILRKIRKNIARINTILSTKIHSTYGSTMN